MKKDLCDLSAEISGISRIITSLSNQIDGDCDQLRPEALHTALFGISSYLDRIAEDLEHVEVNA